MTASTLILPLLVVAVGTAILAAIYRSDAAVHRHDATDARTDAQAARRAFATLAERAVAAGLPTAEVTAVADAWLERPAWGDVPGLDATTAATSAPPPAAGGRSSPATGNGSCRDRMPDRILVVPDPLPPLPPGLGELLVPRRRRPHRAHPPSGGGA